MHNYNWTLHCCWTQNWFQVTMQLQQRKKLFFWRVLGKRQEKLGEDGGKEWGEKRKWVRIRGREQYFYLRNKENPYPECRYELFVLSLHNQQIDRCQNGSSALSQHSCPFLATPSLGSRSWAVVRTRSAEKGDENCPLLWVTLWPLKGGEKELGRT